MKHPVRRPLAAVVAGAFALGALAAAPPAAAIEGTDLILSEVIEGSSNNKAVEIYNPTSGPVTLDGYVLQQYSNGGTSPTTIASLSGTLGSGAVYVVASASANPAILTQADATTAAGLFNGDDAIALRRSGALIDVFGQIGFDPGTFWGTGGDITQDRTLRREAAICSGDTDGADAFDPTAGWDIFPVDTVSDLGVHTSLCDVDPEPEPEPEPVADCASSTVTIGSVQGTGTTSPVNGTTVRIEGAVVADFQTTDLDGFYLQDAGDGDPGTSDGVFVYQQDDDDTPGNGDGILDVSVGDIVNVAGAVSEFTGLTEVTANDTEVCQTGGAAPAPVELSLPLTQADREAHEGMYVALAGTMTIAEYFEYGRFNTVTLTPHRQFQPTAIIDPGPEAAALGAANLAEQIILDDARTRQNPDPLLHPDGQPFTLEHIFRGGDTLTGITGVLDQRRRTGSDPTEYGIQPTQPAGYQSVNPRTGAPDVGGDLKVSSFNVLNYFTTLNSRGANSPEELARQQAKIVAALAEIDADVFGLIEIENNGDAAAPAVPAVETLTEALNTFVGQDVYSYIDTPKIGTDVITTAFVYKTATVEPLGEHQLLTAEVDPRFIDTLNRPALAQTFRALEGGEPVTVVVNHLKSKSSPCDAVGDPDAGDGSGNCDVTRTNAALALVDWLADDPTGQGTGDRALVIGDLNAYDKEDPIDVFTAAGYTDLLLAYQGEYAYSYVFDGQLGYLDHALASAGLVADVTGASTWAINADEAQVLDYNVEFKPASQVAGLYAPDPFRSSDHDPVLVGIDLDTTPPTLSVTASPEVVFPPNGKERTVTVTLVAQDESGGEVTVELVSAEASGSKKAAVTTVDDTTFRVVAASKAVYEFTYRATDAAGNSTTESVRVVVGPHNGS